MDCAVLVLSDHNFTFRSTYLDISSVECKTWYAPIRIRPNTAPCLYLNWRFKRSYSFLFKGLKLQPISISNATTKKTQFPFSERLQCPNIKLDSHTCCWNVTLLQPPIDLFHFPVPFQALANWILLMTCGVSSRQTSTAKHVLYQAFYLGNTLANYSVARFFPKTADILLTMLLIPAAPFRRALDSLIRSRSPWNTSRTPW